MTQAIGPGSRVFVGGSVLESGTVVGAQRLGGCVDAHWQVELRSGERLLALPEMLIDCTQLVALCPNQLMKGGRA